MVGRLIQVAKSAYQYPLLFKQLWHTPLLHAADQEIVYRDLKRFTYRQIEERIGRLASALDKIYPVLIQLNFKPSTGSLGAPASRQAGDFLQSGRTVDGSRFNHLPQHQS